MRGTKKINDAERGVTLGLEGRISSRKRRNLIIFMSEITSIGREANEGTERNSVEGSVRKRVKSTGQKKNSGRGVQAWGGLGSFDSSGKNEGRDQQAG